MMVVRTSNRVTCRHVDGPVFRNPPGNHAARLIEGSGLEGLRIVAREAS